MTFFIEGHIDVILVRAILEYAAFCPMSYNRVGVTVASKERGYGDFGFFCGEILGGKIPLVFDESADSKNSLFGANGLYGRA